MYLYCFSSDDHLLLLGLLQWPPDRSPCFYPQALPNYQFLLFSCSVVLTLWDPMDCSTLGFPVLHYLLEFAQTRVHWVDNAIEPSNPLSIPSPPALNPSQHQGLFQWVSSSHQVVRVGASASASVLPMNIQDWFPLGMTGLISLQFKGPSKVFSSTTVWKHQFFSAQPSWPNSHIHTWLLEKPDGPLTRQTFVNKGNVSAF